MGVICLTTKSPVLHEAELIAAIGKVLSTVWLRAASTGTTINISKRCFSEICWQLAELFDSREPLAAGDEGDDEARELHELMNDRLRDPASDLCKVTLRKSLFYTGPGDGSGTVSQGDYVSFCQGLLVYDTRPTSDLENDCGTAVHKWLLKAVKRDKIKGMCFLQQARLLVGQRNWGTYRQRLAGAAAPGFQSLLTYYIEGMHHACLGVVIFTCKQGGH